MSSKKIITRSLVASAIILLVFGIAACENTNTQSHPKQTHEKMVQNDKSKKEQGKGTANKVEKSSKTDLTKGLSTSSSSRTATGKSGQSRASQSSRIRISSPAQARVWIIRKIGGGDKHGPFVYSYMSNTVNLNGMRVYWVKGPGRDYYVDREGNIYNDSAAKVAGPTSPDVPVIKKQQKKFVINNADEAVNALKHQYGDQGWNVMSGTMGMSNNPSWTISSAKGQTYVIYATDGHIEKQ